MPRTGGFKPALRIMALSKRHSTRAASDTISSVRKSTEPGFHQESQKLKQKYAPTTMALSSVSQPQA